MVDYCISYETYCSIGSCPTSIFSIIAVLKAIAHLEVVCLVQCEQLPSPVPKLPTEIELMHSWYTIATSYQARTGCRGGAP